MQGPSSADSRHCLLYKLCKVLHQQAVGIVLLYFSRSITNRLHARIDLTTDLDPYGKTEPLKCTNQQQDQRTH